MFALKKVCDACPFRRDSMEGWLGEQRITEIIDGTIKGDEYFICHKTLHLEKLKDLSITTNAPKLNAIQNMVKYVAYFRATAIIYDTSAIDANISFFIASLSALLQEMESFLCCLLVCCNLTEHAMY